MLELIVDFAPVTGKDIAMLEDVVLNVWELYFVLAETGVTALVVTETVLEAVVMVVVELVVMVVTALEVLGKEVGGVVAGMVVVVVTVEPIKIS